jgi:DNA-binding IclR family transcriptional regulator
MGEQTAKTTVRSLSIVDIIQRLDGATLDELTTELEMARSTVHVHLRTLINHGYLTKEGEVYHVGLRFLNHGEYARSRKQAYVLAEETISNLSSQIDEEVEFVVESNGRGILVHESFHPDSQFDSKDSHTSPSGTSTGIYYYLHSVATGKAILAEYSKNRVDEILDQWGLREQTEKTITDRASFFEILETIEQQGIAFADEEYVDGLREVGRRVKNPDGSVLGAIAVIGPTYRFQNERFTDEIPDLLEDHVTTLEMKIEEAYREEHF